MAKGRQTLTDSANDIRGHSRCCANTRWSKVTGLNSEPGVSAVPVWLLMASLRLVNVWRIFQLCWAAWRVHSKTNEGWFGGKVVWVTSLLTACR